MMTEKEFACSDGSRLDQKDTGAAGALEKLPQEEEAVLRQGIRFHPGWGGENECFLIQEHGVPVIKFRAFQKLDFMEHGFSTRLGGVSRDALSSLNLSYQRGDDPARVEENYRRMLKALHMDRGRLVLSDQVHETTVSYVDGEIAKVAGTDGLMTDRPGVALATSYADCVPLFFADPAHRAVAASHAGWRGSAAGMGRRTVEAMKERFHTRPEDLICVIGPSICRDCYEVSREVREAFSASFSEPELSALFLQGKQGQKYWLDLWEANRMLLKKSGVPEENIHVAGVCTCCNSRILYSHRASGGRRGNCNGFLMIKERF